MKSTNDKDYDEINQQDPVIIPVGKEEEEEEVYDVYNDDKRHVIDTKALNGLRGIASLHVAISNYAQYCKGYFQGNFSVTLFLCLSGYILTICYCNRDISTKDKTWKFAKEFYTKRFAKLLPMYWTSLIYYIVEPTQMTNYDDGYTPAFNLDKKYAILTGLSIILANPWIGQYPWSKVGWTVSVLAFFYLCFPYLLKWLKVVKNRGQVFVYCYVSQILLCYVFYLFGVYALAQAEYTTPLSVDGVLFGRGCPPGYSILFSLLLPSLLLLERIPLFVAAMVIGLDRAQPQSESHGPSSYLMYRLFEDKDETKTSTYQRNILIMLMILITLLSILSFMWFESILDCVSNYIATLLEPVLVLPYIMLIHSLTSKHGSKTRFASFLNWDIFQYLGDMSYSFYLTHVSTAEYLIWIIFGKNTFRNDSQHTGLVFLPGWIIPVALVVAIVIGRIFYILLEKPTRSAIVERFINRFNNGYNDNINDNKKDEAAGKD